MSSPRQPNNSFNVPSFLYSALKQKDIAAFEFLYDKYSTALYSLIIGIIPEPVSANTILEKVFAISWSSIASYDPARSTIFTWMYAIARKETLLQKRQQELSRFVKPDHAEPFRDVVELKGLIGELPEPYRSILLLSYFENASEIEISAVLDIDLSLVKSFRNKGLVIVNRMIAKSDEIKNPSIFQKGSLLCKRVEG